MASSLITNLRSAGRRAVGRLWWPNRRPTPPPKPFSEMGVAGTAVFGGYVQVKERSPDWVGRQKYVTATELAVNTSIVAAGVHYFLNLVAYPKWTVRPSDDDDEEAVELAEFVDDVINKMTSPWYKVVRRAAMYRFHGFGIQEWTAKRREDGLVGFKDVEARPQHTIEEWDVDEDGSVLGVWQRSPQTGNLLGLPRPKLMYLVEDTLTDSPEGLGLFRHMADPYNRLKMLQELEIRAYERDMRGVPIARMPLAKINEAVEQGVLTTAQAQQLIDDMETMVRLQVKQSDTGLVLDSTPYFSQSADGPQVSAVPQWGFDLLQGGGVGHGEIASAIDRLQREIARMIGVEHLMMGDVGGNRALAEDKSRNLYLIANSVLQYIASQAEHDLIPALWLLNGFDWNKKPTLETEDVTFKNAEAISAALNKMAAAGAVLAPNDPVINDVRDLLGISRVPEDIMAAGATPALPPELAGLIPPQLQTPGRVGPNGGPPGGGGPTAGPQPPPNPKGGLPGGVVPPPTGAPGEDDEKPPKARKSVNGHDVEKGYPEFNPDEPRDELGRWTSGGGGGTSKYHVEGKGVVARGLRKALNERVPERHRRLLQNHNVKFYGVNSIPVNRLLDGMGEGGSVLGLTRAAGGGDLRIPGQQLEIYIAENAVGLFSAAGKKYEELLLPVRSAEGVALHEIGHAIDYLSNWKLNDAFYVPMLHEALRGMEKADAKDGWYFLSTPHEAFAELYHLAYGRQSSTDDLMFFGGLNRKEALKIFKGSVTELKKLNLDAFNRAPETFIVHVQRQVREHIRRSRR